VTDAVPTRADTATTRAVSQRARIRRQQLGQAVKRKVKDAVPFERKRTTEAPVPHMWMPDVLTEVCTAQLAAMPHQQTAEGQLIAHHLVSIVGLMSLARPTDADGGHSQHTPFCGCDLT